MGPSPFSDGNRSCNSWLESVTPSFNGAIAFQRWKHAGITMMIDKTRDLQWGHRLSAMETGYGGHGLGCWWSSFNGAIAFQRWKRPDHRDNHGSDRPSMGPSPFSDGNNPRFRPSWLYPSPFNGATAFQRWKLQTSSLGDWASIGPSMGPPPFSDGNRSLWLASVMDS